MYNMYQWTHAIDTIQGEMTEAASEAAIGIVTSNPDVCREAVVEFIRCTHDEETKDMFETEKFEMWLSWASFAAEYLTECALNAWASGDQYL